jgi:natural product precursor
MKKKTKKLVLAKETVRSLSAVDLKEVAGGTTWQGTCACGSGQCWSSPDYTCQNEWGGA